MQYGNGTMKKGNMGSGKQAFKSYYVVWKRIEAYDNAREMEVFKSYYVVWKLGTEDKLLFFEKSLKIGRAHV